MQKRKKKAVTANNCFLYDKLHFKKLFDLICSILNHKVSHRYLKMCDVKSRYNKHYRNTEKVSIIHIALIFLRTQYKKEWKKCFKNIHTRYMIWSLLIVEGHLFTCCCSFLCRFVFHWGCLIFNHVTSPYCNLIGSFRKDAQFYLPKVSNGEYWVNTYIHFISISNMEE